MGNTTSTSSTEFSNINVIRQMDIDINYLLEIVKKKLQILNKDDLNKYFIELDDINKNIANTLPKILQSTTTDSTNESFDKYSKMINVLVRKRLIYRLSYLYINLHVLVFNKSMLNHLSQTNSILKKIIETSTTTNQKDTNKDLYTNIENILKQYNDNFDNNLSQSIIADNIHKYNQEFSKIQNNDIALRNLGNFTLQGGGGTTIDTFKTGNTNIDSFLKGLNRDFSKYKNSQVKLTDYTNLIIKIFTEYFQIYANIIRNRTPASNNVDINLLENKFQSINKWFSDVDFDTYLKKNFRDLYSTIRIYNDDFNNQFISKIRNIDELRISLDQNRV